MTTFPTLRWWNLSQCFTQVGDELERSHWPVDAESAVRPLYWDVDANSPAITLTLRRPSAAALRLGLAPQQTFLAPPRPGDGSWLTSPEGKAVLLAARAAGGVRLQPAVWTRQAQMLRDLLRSEGLVVEPETNCPHGRIFHWNTRIGMRELFLSIPTLNPYLPPSLVCHDTHQLDIASARLGGRDMVVKSNFALGGVGTSMMVDGRRTLGFGGVVASKKKGGYSWEVRDEPIVVEELIGDLKTNTSVTIDVRKTDARLEIVGLSEQLLIEGFQYDGICSVRQVVRKDHENSITEIAESLANALERRGYDGWFNFDCVVTASGKLALVDLNVRRSAPLDAHMIVNRLASAGTEVGAYRFDEVGMAGFSTDADIEGALQRADVAFNGRAGSVALSVPHQSMTTVPFLTVATDARELKERTNVLRHALA